MAWRAAADSIFSCATSPRPTAMGASFCRTLRQLTKYANLRAFAFTALGGIEIRKACEIQPLEERRLLAANIIANVYQDAEGRGGHELSDPPFPNCLVWVDLNNNGAQEADEPAALTDSNGDALFDGLAENTYTLRMQVPSGWQLSFGKGQFRGDYVTATITETMGAKVIFGLT